MSENQELENAIEAIRAGDRASGQRALVAILKANPKNELAWLWLARTMPNDEQRMAALEQCLKVNPHSESARQALEQLRSKRDEEATVTPIPPPPEPQPPSRRSSLAHLPPAQPTPLSDRLAQVEAERSQTKKPEPASTGGDSASGLKERTGATVEPERPASTTLSDIPDTLRRSGLVVGTAAEAKRKPSRKAILGASLAILLLAILIGSVWWAVSSNSARQQELERQAALATGIFLETQRAVQTRQVADHQTQVAVFADPTSTPLPAGTRTEQPTATTTPRATSVPTLAGASSVIGPENVASLMRSTSLPSSFSSALAFSADGRLMADASSLGISVWDARTFEPVRHIFLEEDAEAVAFSPDSQAIFFSQANEANQSLLFSASSFDFGTRLTGVALPNSTLGLYVTPQEGIIVRASFANLSNIQLLDPADGAILSTLEHTGGLLAASMNPSSGVLATGGVNDLIQIWDLESRQLDTVLSGHAADVITLVFSPDGALLASASQDGLIQVWNPENWQLAVTLKEHPLPVQAMAFSPDHRLLVSEDSSGQMLAWDVASGESLEFFTGPTGLQDMVFSVDGSYLALAGEQAIEIWTLPGP